MPIADESKLETANIVATWLRDKGIDYIIDDDHYSKSRTYIDIYNAHSERILTIYLSPIPEVGLDFKKDGISLYREVISLEDPNFFDKLESAVSKARTQQ